MEPAARPATGLTRSAPPGSSAAPALPALPAPPAPRSAARTARKRATSLAVAVRRGAGATSGGVRRGARVTGDGARRGTRRGTELTRHGAVAAARLTGRGARTVGRGVRLSTSWLAGEVLAMAPRIPVRDAATLRAQFPGRSPDEIAGALIDGAARASGGAGAAAGGWSALPVPPSFPLEVAAETLAVVAIEIKLVAELHEAYGMRAPGSVADRMTAYVAAWANRRGVTLAPSGVVLALGSPVRRRLQRRLAVRAGSGVAALGPLLTGVAAGALVNRHETRRLGSQVRDDLRRRALPAGSR